MVRADSSETLVLPVRLLLATLCKNRRQNVVVPVSVVVVSLVVVSVAVVSVAVVSVVVVVSVVTPVSVVVVVSVVVGSVVVDSVVVDSVVVVVSSVAASSFLPQPAATKAIKASEIPRTAHFFEMRTPNPLLFGSASVFPVDSPPGPAGGPFEPNGEPARRQLYAPIHD